jgi:hypothetical protein
MTAHKPPKPKVHHMTPPQLISVFNQSQRLSDADVAAMTAAGGKQLARDVAPFHGLVPALEFVPRGAVPTPGGCPCYIIDEPDTDGALGYHDEDASGLAFIKVFVNPTLDNGGSALVGPDSVSVTLSHELCELVGDAPANKWVDGPTGADFAYELCDAVEGDSYEIDGVSVSNFLLQAFFDPHAEKGSRLDFLSKLTRPFSMTRGGYQITRSEPGKVSQVFAAHDASSVEAAPGIHLHFGPDHPSWKRTTKLAKAALRRGRR